MAKTTNPRPWTEEDVRTLKTLAREKTKTCNRAEAEADPGSDVRQGNRTRRVSGHFSERENGKITFAERAESDSYRMSNFSTMTGLRSGTPSEAMTALVTSPKT
jgi:hypothetical protein